MRAASISDKKKSNAAVRTGCKQSPSKIFVP
jgi:hypothetical protein